MANRTRPLILRVPVNEQERELIEQKMKLIPTKNFAAYARKMLIDGYIIQIEHSDIKAMTAEIQKIGVNVNQIARRANATGREKGVSLLIDIENSIKVQENRGYEQWAKIHNLKQAAKTLNFLTEHQIE